MFVMAPPKKKQRTDTVPLATVSIELKSGEKDTKNVEYNTMVLDCWATVQDHPIFKKIIQAEPPEIKAGGSQTPFKHQDFTKAIKAHGDYTCAINLAWLNHNWTATPGVPIRKSTLIKLRDNVFMEPKAIEQITIAVTSHEEDVWAKKRGTAPSQPGGDHHSVHHGNRAGHQEAGPR